jgi:hypothetical protein
MSNALLQNPLFVARSTRGRTAVSRRSALIKCAAANDSQGLGFKTMRKGVKEVHLMRISRSIKSEPCYRNSIFTLVALSSGSLDHWTPLAACIWRSNGLLLDSTALRLSLSID